MPEIVFSDHARSQMAERGATEAEVLTAIDEGEAELARRNRTLYRKNLPFEGRWRERYYRIKQVAPVTATEGDRLVVVTVYVFYF